MLLIIFYNDLYKVSLGIKTKKMKDKITAEDMIRMLGIEQKPKLTLYGVVARLFCKHDYNLINQYTMDSEFDIVVKTGKTPNTHNSQTRRIVTDYKCEHCKKIKRLTAKTPRS
tara:strand:+ start:1014 stop:1352 length:339 start_codon:yes stop_codon:yes gene_type:complete